jgi:hypothetical protein
MMRRVLMTVGALLRVDLASAQVRENRQVSDYRRTVGLRAEPSCEDDDVLHGPRLSGSL